MKNEKINNVLRLNPQIKKKKEEYILFIPKKYYSYRSDLKNSNVNSTVVNIKELQQVLEKIK